MLVRFTRIAFLSNLFSALLVLSGCNDATTPSNQSSAANYSVTVSGINVTISPSSTQSVSAGATLSFVVSPIAGNILSTAVGGTCPAGSWSGNSYTTGAVVTNCSVVFSSTVPAPSDLSYSTNNATYVAGLPISACFPSVSGGPVTNYSVSPPLPDGITIDSSTGILSGTPSSSAALATYTIRASNSGGSTTFGLQFVITPAPILAHIDSVGALILHMGPNAGLRVNGDISDGDETFLVRHAHGDPGNTVVVQAFGISQKYSGVSYLLADGGNGNDIILAKGNDEFCPGSTTTLCYDGNYSLAGAHLIGGQGTNTIGFQMVGSNGSPIFEGGPLDTMFGGNSKSVFIINVPNGFKGNAAGTITGGLGLSALIIRPVSGNVYFKVSQSNQVYQFKNYTNSSLTTLNSSLSLAWPSSVERLVLAASDGTENAFVVDSTVRPIEVVGGLNSQNDVIQLPPQNNLVIAPALSSHITNTDSPSCALTGAIQSNCSANNYYVGSLYAIVNQSIFDQVYPNSAQSALQTWSEPCAAVLPPGTLSHSCLDLEIF